MGKRFDALVFPGKKHKVFTLSFDDGVVQDRRLVELFNKYGVTGTFNLNYGHFGFKGSKSYEGRIPVDVSKIEVNEVKDLYKGHEVGGHSYNHPDLAAIKSPYMMYEIIEDKKELESIVGKPLKMFAYPYGRFNDDVKNVLRLAGYKGARTTKSTYSFNLPSDPYELNPTCHYNDDRLMDLAKQFVEAKGYVPKMFYVWGHGYELDDKHNWEKLEELLAYISEHKDEIYFASNGDILTYIEAYNRLEYSADGSLIYNPSAMDVEIYSYDNTYEYLKSDTITKIKETGLL